MHFQINSSVNPFMPEYHRAYQVNVLEISNSYDKDLKDFRSEDKDKEKSYQHSQIKNSSRFIIQKIVLMAHWLLSRTIIEISVCLLVSI